MNKLFNSQKIKIFLVILLSFVVIIIFSSKVFLANTPNINPQIAENFKNIPAYIASLPQNISNMLFNNSQSDLNKIAEKASPPAGLIFNSMTKGVSAAEDTANKKVYLKVQPGTYYKIEEVEINGVKKKVIKFYK